MIVQRQNSAYDRTGSIEKRLRSTVLPLQRRTALLFFAQDFFIKSHIPHTMKSLPRNHSL